MNLLSIRIDEKKALPEYVFWFLSSNATRLHFQATCKKAINQASVNQKDEKSIRLPLPPIAEQQRIVDILNHAANIRCLREQAQAKAKEIIPALFVEMFGDPASNPMGWPVKKLSSLCLSPSM